MGKNNKKGNLRKIAEWGLACVPFYSGGECLVSTECQEVDQAIAPSQHVQVCLHEVDTSCKLLTFALRALQVAWDGMPFGLT